MLDPISSIAFEMEASKGVFALLLGSGISYAAKIPTGWDITLDLVRRVAALQDKDCGADPAAWYHANFGTQPSYSDLLDKLASTPTLRQQVIRPYIEPNNGERDRGEKQPTAAHRAIAALMAKGYIKVVLTTNFDQLLEQALADLGVHPIVISSADHVAGSLPLTHAGPTIVKLHGDYLDTRILNTSGELSRYEPVLDQLLDRILDEFGLIICGWSGDWDVALKAAIDRTPSRRFPTYWAMRGKPSAAADALISRRGARVVPIKGADEFFDELAQRVQAVEKLRKPHPLSAELAVAMLKEYLPEPRHQIRLHDLVNNELGRVLSRLDSPDFRTDQYSEAIFAAQVDGYRSALSIMLPMAYTSGLWSSEEQAKLWVDVVTTLAMRRQGAAGYKSLVELRRFPAVAVLYAFGLGAVVGRRPRQFGSLMGKVVDVDGSNAKSLPLGSQLNVAILVAKCSEQLIRTVKGYETKTLPGSELIADMMRPLSSRELRLEMAFDDAFARVELAFTFNYIDHVVGDRECSWAPTGRYAFNTESTEAILASWRTDYLTRTEQSEIAVMSALSKAPRFDDVQMQATRVGW